MKRLLVSLALVLATGCVQQPCPGCHRIQLLDEHGQVLRTWHCKPGEQVVHDAESTFRFVDRDTGQPVAVNGGQYPVVVEWECATAKEGPEK